MKTLLYMAMSGDGIIATAAGGEDFLSHLHWQTFSSLVARHQCFAVGRKTHDAVRLWQEGYSFDSFTDATKIVVSHRAAVDVSAGFALAGSPAEALALAESRQHDTLVLTGGGELNNAFLQQGLVDEILLAIEPVLVGKGIRVFGSSDLNMQLSLQTVRQLEEGILLLHYQVRRKAA